jgi:integrase
MARASTGGIVEKPTSRGTSYGLRFRALGKRQFVHLGHAADGWNRKRAEEELANVLADVRRGIWEPPAPVNVPEPRTMPTFHEFASEWFDARRLEGGRKGEGLSPAGVTDLAWRLSVHLLPFFATKRLDEITVEDVDRYRRKKVAEGRLGASSINKCLMTLASILEVAVEYELVGRNPAKGRRRRLPAPSPRRTWLDRAEHIVALLDGARMLDAKALTCLGQRRALLATLIYTPGRASVRRSRCAGAMSTSREAPSRSAARRPTPRRAP